MPGSSELQILQQKVIVLSDLVSLLRRQVETLAAALELHEENAHSSDELTPSSAPVPARRKR